MGDFLLRVWGGDQPLVAEMFLPEAIEPDGALCYWFPTARDRDAALHAIPRGWRVVHATVNPGEDVYGEIIDTHKETVARITLRLADGREGTYDQSFGYGYPEHGVRYMYEDGNYSCDCNRSTFLEHHCGVVDDAATEMCGHTIELVSLEIL